MRLAPVCFAFAALSATAAACRIDAPHALPTPRSPTRAAGPPGAPLAGRFFARSDGGVTRDLALKRFAVEVTTNPGTVRSHLAMEIAGPPHERVEAVMRLPIPRGAAVTSAILWVAGRPMNGAFVERERAQQIYRSIVARRRDPALVTWDGPDWVAVSIFPLEYGEPRRFELEWVEPAAVVDGVVQYRVPTVSDSGRIVGRAALVVDGRPLAEAGRDVIALRRPPADAGAPVVAGRAPGDPFHRILVRAAPVEAPPRLVAVAETSARMTPGDRDRQRAALAAVLERLPEGAKATVLAADWDTTVIADGVAPAEAARALAKLDGIVSAGALHLERALADGAAAARKLDASSLLFIGRGIDGFGGDALRAPLKTLHDAGVRLSMVALGEVPPPLADAAALTGGEAIDAAAFADALPALIGAVGSRPARPTLTARGIDDWRALETIAGQTVWMGRALEPPQRPGVDPSSGMAEDAAAADLVALWDRARLPWSDRAGHRVAERTTAAALTPLRALLVLESEQDYARNGLAVPEPAAAHALFGLRGKSDEEGKGKMGKLAGKLVEEQAKNSGILGTLRGAGAAEDTPAESAHGHIEGLFGFGNQVGEAYGADSVGGLGLVGTGAGGGATGEATIGLGNLGTIGKASGNDGGGNGSGYGRGAGGLGGRRARAPEVIPGDANVRGPLDKEIIRRIIRRHINEVRYCYEQSLAVHPAIGGRVMVQFTIAASGQVISSLLQNSTVGDARAESCIVQAVRRWEFPRPLGGGIVIVSYPFVLTPGSVAAAVMPSAPEPAVAPDLAPDRATVDAMAALAGAGTLPDRVEKVAALLGLDRTTDPENVAWMIDRRHATFHEVALVARLLDAAGRRRDAVRVLSERAPTDPSTVAAELRLLGAQADATEVIQLSKRDR
jgi:TonB family protein